MEPPVTTHATRQRMLRVVLLSTWLGVVLLAWLAINVGMAHPETADERFTGLWPPAHPYWFNPLIALVAIIPAVLLGWRVARAFGPRSRIGSAGIAFAGGIVTWSIGNLVWFWYNTCPSWRLLGCSDAIDAPYPSGADVGFLLLLPFWAFAMVQLARALATTLGDLVRMSWIPLVAFAVTGYITLPAFTVLGVHVPNRSALFSSGYDSVQTAFSIAYLVSDAALLSLSLMILVRARSAAGGWLIWPMLLASAALAFQYVADLVFDVRVAGDHYYAGDIADLCYFFALFTMTCALHALQTAQERMEQAMLALEPFDDDPLVGPPPDSDASDHSPAGATA